MSERERPEGWGKPTARSKAHYYVTISNTDIPYGRSLCWGWEFTGRGKGFEKREPAEGDCVKCVRKARARVRRGEVGR